MFLFLYFFYVNETLSACYLSPSFRPPVLPQSHHYWLSCLPFLMRPLQQWVVRRRQRQRKKEKNDPLNIDRASQLCLAKKKLTGACNKEFKSKLLSFFSPSSSIVFRCFFFLFSSSSLKGQLISKGLFAILKFFQKTNETILWGKKRIRSFVFWKNRRLEKKGCDSQILVDFSIFWKNSIELTNGVENCY